MHVVRTVRIGDQTLLFTNQDLKGKCHANLMSF